ncbi:MAG: hypothetical protein ACRDQJ_18600 [Pseudonocardiaceae bacterium]
MSEVDQLQATVDGDLAQVDQARSALAAATLVSPITGSVAAVTLAPGRTVSATSSAVISPGAATASAEVVVVSGGAPEVATSVGVAQYGLLAVGQVAGVVPDGSATLLRGTVASVGLTPTQSNGSTTYTVTHRPRQRHRATTRVERRRGHHGAGSGPCCASPQLGGPLPGRLNPGR